MHDFRPKLSFLNNLFCWFSNRNYHKAEKLHENCARLHKSRDQNHDFQPWCKTRFSLSTFYHMFTRKRNQVRTLERTVITTYRGVLSGNAWTSGILMWDKRIPDLSCISEQPASVFILYMYLYIIVLSRETKATLNCIFSLYISSCEGTVFEKVQKCNLKKNVRSGTGLRQFAPGWTHTSYLSRISLSSLIFTRLWEFENDRMSFSVGELCSRVLFYQTTKYCNKY